MVSTPPIQRRCYNKTTFMTHQAQEIFNLTYKQKIMGFIEAFIDEKTQNLASVNSWGKDVTEKLLSFISQGKMIRGSLVLFIYEAYSGNIPDEAIQIAATIELFHSSLLIHDDIMDNDIMRRGKQTIFAQFQLLAEHKKFTNAQHFGESMGISVGDIGFFLGFELLARVGNQAINELCMREMVSVGLAQMQDVYSGYTKDIVTENDIEQVYLYKTGRYTFSLPMMIGALLARQTDVTHLEKLGEYSGLIFQHTDDALSIFGKQSETGKVEGSDIRENKKTLYRLYLFEKASAVDKKKLETLFGNQQITSQDILYIRELVKKYHIQEIISEKMEKLQSKAKEHIIQLQISKEYKEALEHMVNQMLERKK